MSRYRISLCVCDKRCTSAVLKFHIHYALVSRWESQAAHDTKNSKYLVNYKVLGHDFMKERTRLKASICLVVATERNSELDTISNTEMWAETSRWNFDYQSQSNSGISSQEVRS